MLEDYTNGKIPPFKYMGKYVISTREVDVLHNLPRGTTETKLENLISKEDYYKTRRPEFILGDSFCPIYLTASGYLKVTDDKNIQGQMFNYYFSGKPKRGNVLSNFEWREKVNELVEEIHLSSNQEPLRILSYAYREISDTYKISLNKCKKNYLKENRNKEAQSVTVLEVVRWLEMKDIIPRDTLITILSRIKDERDSKL